MLQKIQIESNEKFNAVFKNIDNIQWKVWLDNQNYLKISLRQIPIYYIRWNKNFRVYIERMGLELKGIKQNDTFFKLNFYKKKLTNNFC